MILRLVKGLLGCAGILLLFLQPAAANESSDQLFAERQQYRDALAAMRRGRLNEFKHLAEALQDYPLYPYLVYADHFRQLSPLTWQTLHNYQLQWPDNPMGSRLESRWRQRQAERSNWTALAATPEPQAGGTGARCHWLYARYSKAEDQPDATGIRADILSQAAQLWLVGHSQPDACDRLFHLYVQSGQVTANLGWQRLQMALAANNRKLAHYLVRFVAPDDQDLANLAVRLHRTPQELRQFKLLSSDTSKVRQVVTMALTRLARRDPAAAQRWADVFLPLLAFPEETRHDLSLAILEGLAIDGLADDLDSLAGNMHRGHALDERHQDMLEALALQAIRGQDWPQVLRWLSVLPDSASSRPRWQYWRARALQGTEQPPNALVADAGRSGQPSLGSGTRQAAAIYTGLADSRNFYGYMSAHQLGQQPALAHVPATVDPAVLAQVARIPGLLRARELYVLDDLVAARREWLHASRTLTDQQLVAAAELARGWGWHRMAIQATIDAEAWNTLELRFPAAWPDLMLHQALATNLSPDWLFAVARQESAFMADARSPAGALGLMQVMPATAKRTARRFGLDYQAPADLLQPQTNVAIGSTYLADMYRRFGLNRVLASAAYNAGPGRVDRWLNDLSDVPVDVWIEAIPYRETREYVKNILVYSWIYGQRLEQPRPFLDPQEQRISPPS